MTGSPRSGTAGKGEESGSFRALRESRAEGRALTATLAAAEELT